MSAKNSDSRVGSGVGLLVSAASTVVARVGVGSALSPSFPLAPFGHRNQATAATATTSMATPVSTSLTFPRPAAGAQRLASLPAGGDLGGGLDGGRVGPVHGSLAPHVGRAAVGGRRQAVVDRRLEDVPGHGQLLGVVPRAPRFGQPLPIEVVKDL